MSQKRQSAILDAVQDKQSLIVTLTRDYRPSQVIPEHFHDRDQLVFASRGVMTIRTTSSTWVVPIHRAVWIPAAVPHTVAMSGAVAMRTLYLKPNLVKTLPRACCVVNVSPLLKELILHACNFPGLKRRVQWQCHLIDVIVDQLRVVHTVPLQLPNLSDPRALRVTQFLMKTEGRRSLAHICKIVGASKRTVERIFQAEAGMTFGKWRQQLRLMHAMRSLGEGTQVTRAALEAGYSTPSAFSAAFRKALGTTPTQYFKASPRLSGEPPSPEPSHSHPR